ncbi:MAG: hypothetical protein IJR95_07335 [Lachnospiraceae bacterium]|nr:hypothetical protein [Lachnospiraceae bacterium]
MDIFDTSKAEKYHFLSGIKIIISVPSRMIVVIVTVTAAVVLFLSYYLHTKGCQWLSNVLISVACGLFTGIVLCIYSNYRHIALARIESEYTKTKSAVDYLYECKYDVKALSKMDSSFDEDKTIFDSLNQIRESFDEIEDIICEIPERVFDKVLDFDEKYPLRIELRDQIEAAYKAIKDEEDEEGIRCFCELSEEAYKNLIAWLVPVKNDLEEKYRAFSKTIL